MKKDYANSKILDVLRETSSKEDKLFKNKNRPNWRVKRVNNPNKIGSRKMRIDY